MVSETKLYVRSHVARDLLQNAALFKTDKLVVWEYVSNSLQYVDPGTNPVVQVLLDGKKKRITVTDNGRGMDLGGLQNFFVMHGVLLGTQSPLGSGGILITDKKYKNFELYMEVKPDWGCDSGVFFRATEDGVAYQVTLDYLPTGILGNVNVENGLAGVGGHGATLVRRAGAGVTRIE